MRTLVVFAHGPMLDGVGAMMLRLLTLMLRLMCFDADARDAASDLFNAYDAHDIRIVVFDDGGGDTEVCVVHDVLGAYDGCVACVGLFECDELAQRLDAITFITIIISIARP